MPDPARRWPDNAAGAWFVDEECIDCDLCRTTAALHFERSEDGYSFVSSQPTSPAEVADCQLAQNECPVDAIGDMEEDAAEASKA